MKRAASLLLCLLLLSLLPVLVAGLGGSSGRRTDMAVVVSVTSHTVTTTASFMTIGPATGFRIKADPANTQPVRIGTLTNQPVAGGLGYPLSANQSLDLPGVSSSVLLYGVADSGSQVIQIIKLGR